ncbi:MAG: YoaK family protein [Betaproteobacteria bacterium]
MPIKYFRSLAGRDRTQLGNRRLGYSLTFIAGAANAGGFLAVAQYTSHMTGIVSAMADHIAIGEYLLVLSGMGGLLSFIGGAACSAMMINFARRRKLNSEYALPLLLEAAMLLFFGILGARLAHVGGLLGPVTVMLLCFIMGLQNAVISKISHAEIRTTHITGMVTDFGIELGKLAYWNAPQAAAEGTREKVTADRNRLRVLGLMVMFFFVGGLIGALGFRYIGFASTIPLAFALVLLAIIPATDDIVERMRRKH